MNAPEQRRARRKRVSEPIEVMDALSGESLGRIGNLSRDGMMLIGRRKLGDGALYQARFQLHDPQGAPCVIEAGLHEMWGEPAAVPGQYWTGLRIVSLSDDDAAALNAWLGESDTLKIL
ncbi:MAG: PilZ domain-containing protein [Rhodanobacteraceae bacterium]